MTRSLFLFAFFLALSGALTAAEPPTVAEAQAAWQAAGDNDDLRLAFAFALYRDGRWGEAEEHFRQILARRPDYRDAAEGLASCLAARDAYGEAIETLRPFAGKDGSKDIDDRIVSYEMARGNYLTARCLIAEGAIDRSYCAGTAPRIASFEGAFSYTLLTRRDDWLYDHERVGFYPYEMFGLALYHEGHSRYGLRDDLVGATANIRPYRLLTVTLDHFHTPEHDFLARHRSLIELRHKTPELEELVFEAGYRFYDFDYGPDEQDTARVYRYDQMVTLGAEYYLPKGFMVGYRTYLVLNRKDDLVHAHQGYGGWEKERLLGVTAGFSLGDEFISNQSSTGMFTQNYFVRAALTMLCPFAFTILLQHTVTDDGIHRTEFLGGIRYDL